MAAHVRPATVGGAKRPFCELSGAARGSVVSRLGSSFVHDSDSTSDSDVLKPARMQDMRRHVDAGDGNVAKVRSEAFHTLEQKTQCDVYAELQWA